MTATDECGNASTCSQVITIEDTTAPVIVCPADVSHECDAPVDYGMASATDNCNTLSITSSDVTTGDDCLTTITRTWTATDACNNSSTCVQVITIVDTTAPVITGEASLDMPCDAIDMNILVEVTDNCNEWTLTYSDDEVSGGCAGEVIRTYTATDACGNASDFVQILDLFDDVAPVASANPADASYECSDEFLLEEVTFTDSCDEDLSVIYDEVESGDSCESTITRTWVATDAC